MVSTSSDKALITKALEYGADHFFIKPSSFEGLIKMAGELISQYLSDKN